MQKLHMLWSQSTDKSAHTGEVTVRSSETFDKTQLDRVGASVEDNGDRFGRCLCRKRRWYVELRQSRFPSVLEGKLAVSQGLPQETGTTHSAHRSPVAAL